MLSISWADEARHHPTEPADPVEAIKFRMEQSGLTVADLVPAIGRPNRVYEVLNGKRAITPDTAVRLAMYFGNEAAFWMHLQVAWDMHSALREVRASARRP